MASEELFQPEMHDFFVVEVSKGMLLNIITIASSNCVFCLGSTSYLKLNTTNLDVPLSEIVYDIKGTAM